MLADFGEFSLNCQSLSEILTEACRLVSEALGTERAEVLEICLRHARRPEVSHTPSERYRGVMRELQIVGRRNMLCHIANLQRVSIAIPDQAAAGSARGGKRRVSAAMDLRGSVQTHKNG